MKRSAERGFYPKWRESVEVRAVPYPTDRKYTKEHEWVQVNGNSASVGVTDYAQQSLGDVISVEMPKVGAELTAGRMFGTVESVKAISDLFAPVSGTVTEVNADLVHFPERMNKDPYGSWMFKLTLNNPGELDHLLSASDYENFVSEETRH